MLGGWSSSWRRKPTREHCFRERWTASAGYVRRWASERKSAFRSMGLERSVVALDNIEDGR